MVRLFYRRLHQVDCVHLLQLFHVHLQQLFHLLNLLLVNLCVKNGSEWLSNLFNTFILCSHLSSHKKKSLHMKYTKFTGPSILDPPATSYICVGSSLGAKMTPFLDGSIITQKGVLVTAEEVQEMAAPEEVDKEGMVTAIMLTSIQTIKIILAKSLDENKKMPKII
ncbi:uncharacterized protein LOC124811869 isoform X1 [Hydra vulgaris]|uniref:uncharacterized protein LOC124811869 isoform X1 n=1 Tax=Hydra vulgaris TaxID=6087 RepID=UPI0032EA04BE